MKLSRRSALLGLTTAFSATGPLGRMGMALAAAPTDQRFVVILLRGALDGMGAVIPYGDANLLELRRAILPKMPSEPGGMLDLGGFYALHPTLTGMHDLYKTGQLLPVHAVIGPTHSRSHFDAQDCLECGADRRLDSGWLNRAVSAIPGPRPTGGLALSIGVSTPLLLRGPGEANSWAPGAMGKPPADFYSRVAELNHADPLTGPAIAAAFTEHGITQAALAGMADDPATRNGFGAMANAAGRMLAQPTGPRVAALEVGGWDTHAAQKNRLPGALRQLDEGLIGLRDGLGDAWRRTVVLVVTEFGRTARANGTGGTDHGTASVAFLAGGAVAGGRVMGTWPGLAHGQLWDGRDLAPTSDVRGLAKGVLVSHLGVTPAALARIFPGADSVSPQNGLLRT